MIPKDICTSWQALSKIDFNYFDSDTQKKSSVSFKEVEKLLRSQKGRKIVVNGGHFIPDADEYSSVGKNPQKTWTLACQLVKTLKDQGINAKLSLLINDLPLTPKQRKMIKLGLPEPSLKIMQEFGLSEMDVMRNSLHSEEMYTEKKLSNRVNYLVKKTKHMKDYPLLDSHCVSAIIGYLRDIKQQGAEIAVWILPKCSANNYLDAINIFDQVEGGLRHVVFFETENCYL